MQGSDKVQFLSLLTALCATFQVPMDGPLADGYWMALEGLPMESVARAVRRSVGECSMFPRPAELRRLAGCLVGGANALDAWGDVMRQIQAVGSHGVPTFSAEMREAVVACGGWKLLCGSTHDQLHWIKREFVEHYQAHENKMLASPAEPMALPAPVLEDEDETRSES